MRFVGAGIFGQLTAILSASICETLLAAGVHARIGCEALGWHINLPRQSSASLGIIIVAAQGRVVVCRDIGGFSGEGGILVDRQGVVAAADLAGITAARLVALGSIEFLGIQGRAAVAHAIILEASKPEAVA